MNLEKVKRLLNNRTVLVIILLVLTNIFTITIITILLISSSRSNTPGKKDKVIWKPEIREEAKLPEDTSSSSEPMAEQFQFTNDKYQSIVYASSGFKYFVPQGMKDLKINWYNAQSEPFDAKDFFDTKYENVSKLKVRDLEVLIEAKNDDSDYTFYWRIYKLGIVASTSEVYSGMEVFNISLGWADMDGGETVVNGFVVADEKNNQLVLLRRYSEIGEKYSRYSLDKVFLVDENAYIADWEVAKTLSFPGYSKPLVLADNYYLGSYYIDNDPGLYIFDTPSGKKVYLNSQGCFSVYNSKGGNATYKFSFPFNLTKSGVLDITFNDGTKNKEDYIGVLVGGCGSFGCGHIIKVDPNVLRKLGKFSNGDTAYEFGPSSVNELGSATDPYLQKTYDEWYASEKPSFEEFLKERPLVLWKMPLEGYYLAFLKSSFIPPVECAKPVIYLYPNSEQNLKVSVAPNGGFSYTNPIYPDGGWLVRANPKSEIFNYADSKQYPYLFWEGKGFKYVRPSQGFVVARENVNKFFDYKLAKLGMIDKEITDFKEFWLPKFTEKPYYFITFLPQNDFEKIAPLDVSPKPDTVIRVFMDYEGLDRPVSVEPLEIKTPERKGFTVVEWGGAKH